MTVERWLQIQMALMASLAAMMLGMGQGSYLLPIAMIVAACGSFVFTDVLGWFRLHRVIANLAMVLAAFFSLNDFFRADSYRQLLAIANLLVYVQIVLVFQQKNYRIYGQVAVFSLLQVVVAALLNEGFVFGLLLVFYMLASLAALGLLFIYRETERLRWRAHQHRERAAAHPALRLSGDDSAFWLTGEPLVVVDERPAAAAEMAGWPLMRQISGMGVATLVITVVFFYCTPRSGGSNWRRSVLTKGGIVGFTDEISLDEIGKIRQSHQVVMRATMADVARDEPYVLIGDPYFRGAVLNEYVVNGGNGSWRQGPMPFGGPPLLLGEAPASEGLVRQDYYLEATNEISLFGIYPYYATANTPEDMRFRPASRRLFRSQRRGQLLSQPYRYAMTTTGFRFRAQLPVTPHVLRPDSARRQRVLQSELDYLARLQSPERFPQLRKLADEVIARDAPQGSVLERARALEDHFLNDKRYRYTLDFTAINEVRDRQLDPIEDFIANHHAGHCEYFASALVLMLRSQGIPARVAVGYKGGDLNYFANYYTVRQSNAHAWVEAYLPAQAIEPNMIADSERHEGGGWLRLDPTPSGDQNNADQRGVFDRMTRSFDYAQWLWNDYVLRLTPDQQQGGMFQPIALSGSSEFLDRIKPREWREFFAERLGIDVTTIGRQARASWQVAFVAVTGIGLLVIVLRYRRSVRWPGRRNRRAGRSKQSGVRGGFIERLEKVLARRGVPLDPSQTEREWMRAATATLGWDRRPQLAGIGLEVVEAYYRVRFGDREPDADELRSIEAAISQLESWQPEPDA